MIIVDNNLNRNCFAYYINYCDKPWKAENLRYLKNTSNYFNKRSNFTVRTSGRVRFVSSLFDLDWNMEQWFGLCTKWRISELKESRAAANGARFNRPNVMKDWNDWFANIRGGKRKRSYCSVHGDKKTNNRHVWPI